MKMDYDDFIHEKWELDVAESITGIDCYVRTLATMLINKGICTTEEFNTLFEENKKSDYYTKLFKGISEQRDLIKQYESGEKDPIKDWFKDLFNKE